MPYERRCKRIQALLREEDLDAILVTGGSNRYYLSGFRGSAGCLLVTANQAFLLTDGRYVDQAKQQTACCQVLHQGADWYNTLNQLLKEHQVRKLAFEQEHVSHGEYLRLAEKVSGATLIGKRNFVETFREIKDGSELELMKKAASIADQAFHDLLSILRPGLTETEVAAQLEYRMRRLGSEGPAFDTIVASGPRAALPHGTATDRRIAPGDFVVFDFGATYQGYRSDMTRTVVIGQASSKQKEIYQLVLRAQLAGLQAVKANETCESVDSAAREVIAKEGYGEFFGHSLGHGVGLDVHENPRLAQGNKLPLKPGMVVTVEPGVYLTDWGGVRIEDMVLVTGDGCEILTHTSKELLEIA
ncbi:MAG TPA: aminopeptidase P family protein [Clostridia bacterium]|nr:aminopeptidase P family protein [Clostridia bacterium]